MKQLKNDNIVIFDGICNLCNSSVQFIIKNDTKERFLFASLQSDVAKDILLQFPSKKNKINSILLIENGNIYEKSTAVLKIAKHLKQPINILYYFIIIPKSIRNILYNYIANNRYKWYGKSENCIIHTVFNKQCSMGIGG